MYYNKKVQEPAGKPNLPCFDAYGLMAPHPEMKRDDGTHFNEEGNLHLGKAIANAIIDRIF